VDQVRGERLDECSNDLVKQLTLQAIAMTNHVVGAQALQLHIATDGRKNMVANRGGLAGLTMLDVANLFERPVVLLDLPVLVMEFEKHGTTQRRPSLVIIRLIQSIMAWLVFQPRPEHLDRAESA
jgi:hypothetical protein